MTRRSTSRKSRGSALIAILWVVAILAILVFSTTQFLFVELESESNASAMFRAEQLADRGIALAAHPDVEPGDPILRQQLSEAESFFATISTEGARLNLNTLLANSLQDRIVLEQLFVDWGLRIDEATLVVDNLIDWVDRDDTVTGLGAERLFYLRRERLSQPFNEPFESLDEVTLVNEFERVIAIRPDWQDAFTLLSSGPLDLNEAAAELIAVACECGPIAASALVATRNGPDRLLGTDDDYRFETLDEALQLLNLPEDLAAIVGPRVTIDDPIKRLVSVGRFGAIAVERTATVQYTGATGEVQRWTSRRIE